MLRAQKKCLKTSKGNLMGELSLHEIAYTKRFGLLIRTMELTSSDLFLVGGMVVFWSMGEDREDEV